MSGKRSPEVSPPAAPGADDLTRLAAALRRHPGLVVALSGGVDSTVLLAAAAAELGRDRVVAVTAVSPSLAAAERDAARRLAAQVGVEHHELATTEFDDPRYRANAGDRCYWCKDALFRAAGPLADARGFALAYGENADDQADDRPGTLAAVRHGVVAPLREAGWGKDLVRAHARSLGLPVADKPAMPCLASRIPVGQPVELEALERVEQLEVAARALGLVVVRARHLPGPRARLEVGADDWAAARRREDALRSAARAVGFLDLELGRYRSGAVSAPPLRRW